MDINYHSRHHSRGGNHIYASFHHRPDQGTQKSPRAHLLQHIRRLDDIPLVHNYGVGDIQRSVISMNSPYLTFEKRLPE